MSEKPKRFTEVITMLTSIDKDASGGKSETEEGDMLDCQLCSSDEMSNDEKTEQFDNAQPIVHIGDLQTSDTNIEIYSIYWPVNWQSLYNFNLNHDLLDGLYCLKLKCPWNFIKDSSTDMCLSGQ